MAHASFDGLRVLALEARRAKEVAKLIQTYGGEPVVVPALREVPLESNRQALAFSDRLIDGDFDLVIFFTGVGVRALLDIVQTRHDREVFLDALRKVKVAARGPKPQGALRELKIPVLVSAPEPSTWRELLPAIQSHFGEELSGMRVAVQEYGASNPEFLSSLTDLCSEVTKVPVYQWALPEDLGPLRECVLNLIAGKIDVVLFMTAVQVIHLFQIADEMNCREDLRKKLSETVVVSIGPTTSEELAHYGVTPDFEPSRPKMAFLVNEAAQYAQEILSKKRAAHDATSILQPPSSHADMVAVDSPALPTQNPPGVRRIAPSTSTMAGFCDGLAPTRKMRN